MTAISFDYAQPIVGGRCRVLAEAGQCMEGSIDTALQMVDDVADAGAWGIKTQLLRPETIATPDAPKYWDDEFGTRTQQDAFRAAGLIGYDRWGPVRQRCADRGIAFVATPFDLDAVDALEDIDVDAYKVASGDLTWVELLDRVVDTRRPVLLSTGAAWQDEVETAVERMLARDPSLRYRLVLLACSLVYPTPTADANVGRVGRLREMVSESGWSCVRVGYSDHTTVPWTAQYAAAAGAVLVEKHYTLAGLDGPVADHGMAVDGDGLAAVVSSANRGAAMWGVDSIMPTVKEERARYGARRAVYAVRDIAPGAPVSADDVVALRPCPPNALDPAGWARLVADGARWRVGCRAGDPVRVGSVG